MRVRRRFRFESAHRLPQHPGKCRELHGHRYVLYVTLDRSVEASTGMVMDFADLKQTVGREVVDRLDHKYLNDVMQNPTAELIAVWIWQRLFEALPGLVEIELQETENCSVIYRGQ